MLILVIIFHNLHAKVLMLPGSYGVKPARNPADPSQYLAVRTREPCVTNIGISLAYKA